jgi:SecY interacting protein Syd
MSTNSADALISSLEQFHTAYIDLIGNGDSLMMTEFDSDWLSPCIQLSEESLATMTNGSAVPWKPVKRDANLNLDNLASALEIDIDPQLSALFCSYFSHDLPASAQRGDLDIIQVWNEDDFERLQKNLIAHVLMKRRLKHDDTLFFATTDQEEFIISLDVNTGNVMLEQVGKVPQEVLAPDIATFISGLTPRPVVASL